MGEPQPPRDIVAMSYGCTCPGTDDGPPYHTADCRYGQAAAVKIQAWQEQSEQLHLAQVTIGKLSAQLALADQVIEMLPRFSRDDSDYGQRLAAYDQAREAATTRGDGQ